MKILVAETKLELTAKEEDGLFKLVDEKGDVHFSETSADEARKRLFFGVSQGVYVMR